MILLALGAGIIAFSVSQETKCSSSSGSITSSSSFLSSVPSCTSETNWIAFVAVAAGIFLGGAILYYPLYFSLASLSDAVADLLLVADGELTSGDGGDGKLRKNPDQ